MNRPTPMPEEPFLRFLDAASRQRHNIGRQGSRAWGSEGYHLSFAQELRRRSRRGNDIMSGVKMA